MAALLAGMSEAKLKLLNSAFKNLAEVAKNSGGLNDVFSAMKEGSMITAPWQLFLDLLKAETTRASIDSIRELFNLATSSETKDVMGLIGGVIGQLSGEFASNLKTISVAITLIADSVGGFENLSKIIGVVVGLLTGDMPIGGFWLWIENLINEANKVNWGDRRTGMGEGFVPGGGGGYDYQGGGGR